MYVHPQALISVAVRSLTHIIHDGETDMWSQLRVPNIVFFSIAINRSSVEGLRYCYGLRRRPYFFITITLGLQNLKTKLTRSKVEVLSTRPTRFFLFISSRQIMFNLIILCNLSSKFPSSKTRSAVPDVQTLPQLSRVRHWHSPNTEPRLVTIIRVCLLSICYCGLIIALLSVDEFLLILFTWRCLRLCSGKTWIKNKKYSVGRSSFQKYFHIKFYRNRRD